MSKISPLFHIVMLFTVLLTLFACGNKGELYRESDAAALEAAAEKVKKAKKEKESEKNQAQDPAAPAAPATGE